MIKVIPNFLSPEECRGFIDLINEKTKEKQIPFTNTSTNFNHKYIDFQLSQMFFDRIISMCKENDFIRPNNLVMIAKYCPGESFGIHTDTGLFYSRSEGLKTRYTVLIYLNDDFEGGNTTFYDNNFKITEVIVPKQGHCLIFDIDLFHEGNRLLSGNKYWIGCEIIGKIN